MGKGGGKKALAKVNLMMTVTGIFGRQRLESADKMLSVKEVKIISHFFFQLQLQSMQLKCIVYNQKNIVIPQLTIHFVSYFVQTHFERSAGWLESRTRGHRALLVLISHHKLFWSFLRRYIPLCVQKSLKLKWVAPLWSHFKGTAL